MGKPYYGIVWGLSPEVVIALQIMHVSLRWLLDAAIRYLRYELNLNRRNGDKTNSSLDFRSFTLFYKPTYT